MSYKYSKRICREALRLMNSDEDFESRLRRAFAEMSVSNQNDTSDEIWEKWLELKKKYQIVSGEIWQERNEGINTEEMKNELRKFGDSFIALISDWQKFIDEQINKGVLRKEN